MKLSMAFHMAAVAIGGATTGLFILMAILGKVYAYENNAFILAVEIILPGAFTLWAVERLAKDLRK